MTLVDEIKSDRRPDSDAVENQWFTGKKIPLAETIVSLVETVAQLKERVRLLEDREKRLSVSQGTTVFIQY